MTGFGVLGAASLLLILAIAVVASLRPAAGDEAAAPLPARDFPGPTWLPAEPAQVGLDRERLDAFVRGVTEPSPAWGPGVGGAVYYRGYRVREWGFGGAKPIDWASASKPVLTTLTLVAVERALIASVHAEVGPFEPCLSGDDVAITFHHLANMISGYALEEPPGEAFGYNDFGVNLWGHALFYGVFAPRHESRGPTLVLRAELAALGFEHAPRLGGDPGDSDTRYGRLVACSTDDLARIGWLWISDGRWEDRRLVAPGAFGEAFRNHVPRDLPRSAGKASPSCDYGSFGGSALTRGATHAQGRYGYAVWVTNDAEGGRTWRGVPADTLAAIGHGGQEVMVVIPSLGIVAAGRGTWGDPNEHDGEFAENLRRLASSIRVAATP